MMHSLLILKRVGLMVSAGILVTATLLAIATLTPRKWDNVTQTKGCTFPIYVSGDMMHTNLFIPVQTSAFDWNQQLDLAQIGKTPASSYRYLQFGWGDRIFYMETPSWGEVQPTNALRALFAPQNASALFIKGHATLPQYPNETLRCLNLSQTDYLALMTFLKTNFQLDTKGQKQRLGSGQDGDSSFYAAKGHYSILKTCNSWTADGLRAANVNTPLWGGLAPSVMHHLQDSCSCRE